MKSINTQVNTSVKYVIAKTQNREPMSVCRNISVFHAGTKAMRVKIARWVGTKEFQMHA